MARIERTSAARHRLKATARSNAASSGAVGCLQGEDLGDLACQLGDPGRGGTGQERLGDRTQSQEAAPNPGVAVKSGHHLNGALRDALPEQNGRVMPILETFQRDHALVSFADQVLQARVWLCRRGSCDHVSRR